MEDQRPFENALATSKELSLYFQTKNELYQFLASTGILLVE